MQDSRRTIVRFVSLVGNVSYRLWFLAIVTGIAWPAFQLVAQESANGAAESSENQDSSSTVGTPLTAGQFDGRYLGVEDPASAGRITAQFAEEKQLPVPQQVVWEGGVVDPVGATVRQIKYLDDDFVIRTQYILPTGELLNREDFRAYINSFKPDPIHADLQNLISVSGVQDLIPVIITIRSQPLHEQSNELRARAERSLSQLAQEIKDSDPPSRLQVNTRYDELTKAIRDDVKVAIRLTQAKKTAQLDRWIRQHGGQVGRLSLTHSMFSARVPALHIKKLALQPGVQCLDLNGHAEASLDVSVASVRASAFWDGGFDGGASAFEPGVLDSGLDVAHPALSGLNVLYHIDHFWASRSSSYNDSWTNPNDFHGHGTAVTGIIASRGSASWENWKGMTPGVSRLFNLKSAYRTTNGSAGLFFSDAIDNIDWGVFDSTVDDIDVLNFSYGIATGSDDTSLARFMDALVDDLDIPVVVAAGNSGPNSFSVINPGNAYNILCVASMNDINTSNRSDDVIAFSSSRGPTDGGRKKPDLTAPGSYIKTLNKDWETEFNFNTWSGTSFATPHVTGAVLLMMDYYGSPVQPKRIKAVLLNSAGKWGSLDWNSTYGWGYLDLQKAWETKDDCFQKHVSPEGYADDFDLYLADFRPSRDMATLVWNRHIDYRANGNYPNAWYGLNDLDLSLYHHETGQLLDVSASGIDNVEQVRYQPAETTQCVIRVEAEDRSFSGTVQEQYALAGPPGLEFPASLPQISLSIVAPSRVRAGTRYSVVVTLENTGDINAISPSVSLSLPEGHTIVEGPNPQNSATLINHNSNQPQIIWTVRAPRKTGFGQVRVDVASQCWGETWTGSKSQSIVVSSR